MPEQRKQFRCQSCGKLLRGTLSVSISLVIRKTASDAELPVWTDACPDIDGVQIYCMCGSQDAVHPDDEKALRDAFLYSPYRP